MTETKKITSLKLDEETKMKLKQVAKKENRTLHGLIIHILKNFINQHKN